MSALDHHDRRLALVGTLLGVAITLVSILGNGGDIAGLIKFGETPDAVELTAHVERVLDRDVVTVDAGHDGMYFYVQALDPFFLDPDLHGVQLDRPHYRAQRMLFPLVAGAGGLMPAELTMWAMAAVNIAAMALGTVGTGRIARRLGGSTWLGLAFALNPGIVFEFDISGAGILAFACAIWGTLAVMEERSRAAVGWFVAAVLAREVMLLYLAGVCCHRLWTTRRVPWLLGGVPFLAVLGWAGYVRLRLDPGVDVDQVQEFGPPFGGMLDSFENWLSQPLQLAIIAGLIAAMPLLVVRAAQRPNPLAWGAVGFILIALLMTRQVWWNFFDISRAIAPIVTAYVVTSFSESSDTHRVAVATA
ncbi:MAG: hypothetical protein AAF548_13765 [Actinomycetota bacterium]